ncbi:MAG: ferredoxin [Candidatus Levyibacteriota bacterium]
MANLKVKVDRNLCIGAGTCIAVSPKVFELDNEGKAVILKKGGSKTSDFVDYGELDDSEANILNGAKACPVNAIIIVEVDEKGKEIRQVYPEV